MSCVSKCCAIAFAFPQEWATYFVPQWHQLLPSITFLQFAAFKKSYLEFTKLSRQLDSISIRELKLLGSTWTIEPKKLRWQPYHLRCSLDQGIEVNSWAPAKYCLLLCSLVAQIPPMKCFEDQVKVKLKRDQPPIAWSISYILISINLMEPPTGVL